MPPNRVKYELHEFEQIISSVGEICGRKQEGFKSIENKITGEVDRIKQTFINEIFGLSDERHLERYIQYHQLALIRLMDESVRRSRTSDAIASQVYQRCYHGLEVLLVFIEKHFTKYFDLNAKAPESYLIMVRNHIRTRVDVLYNGLLDSGACIQITQASIHPLRTIIDDHPANEVSYRRILYAKELQRELSNLMANATAADINDELRSLMYYLDHNSVEAFTCHKQHIDQLLKEAETRSEQIEKLSYELKRVNQARVKPGISCNIYALGLKSQVNNYIREEIEHLRRLQDLAPAPRTSGGIFSGVKVQLEMSVAQVAFFIKLLIDARVIVNSNVTGLLRFLAGFLISKKTETISYDSLRAKYYNVEQSTREAVKGNLLKMVSLIDKN